jgi:hypothetical protein
MLQKCLYSLTSVSGNVITGTHTTPVARSVYLILFVIIIYYVLTTSTMLSFFMMLSS